MNSAHYPFYRILSKQFNNPSHARTRGDQLIFGRTQEYGDHVYKQKDDCMQARITFTQVLGLLSISAKMIPVK